MRRISISSEVVMTQHRYPSPFQITSALQLINFNLEDEILYQLDQIFCRWLFVTSGVTNFTG